MFRRLLSLVLAAAVVTACGCTTKEPEKTTPSFKNRLKQPDDASKSPQQ